MLVQGSTSFQVADHDFTRLSMIPSVSLVVVIPDKARYLNLGMMGK